MASRHWTGKAVNRNSRKTGLLADNRHHLLRNFRIHHLVLHQCPAERLLHHRHHRCREQMEWKPRPDSPGAPRKGCEQTQPCQPPAPSQQEVAMVPAGAAAGAADRAHAAAGVDHIADWKNRLATPVAAAPPAAAAAVAVAAVVWAGRHAHRSQPHLQRLCPSPHRRHQQQHGPFQLLVRVLVLELRRMQGSDAKRDQPQEALFGVWQ
mmetsp:Transcript_17392/g.52098  ORF Transcript_17392/g.52098 Transcript_17392/m.52098 type:complete len:208 (-) Transcript_17392:1055-1678(-)